MSLESIELALAATFTESKIAADFYRHYNELGQLKNGVLEFVIDGVRCNLAPDTRLEVTCRAVQFNSQPASREVRVLAAVGGVVSEAYGFVMPLFSSRNCVTQMRMCQTVSMSIPPNGSSRENVAQWKMTMEKFEWYVRAMAQPSEVQMGLFPSFVAVADELALGWEETMCCYLNSAQTLGAAQIESIKQLDAYLDSISGQHHAETWTTEALAHALEWKIIRRMAKEILFEMKWDDIAPPESDELYTADIVSVRGHWH